MIQHSWHETTSSTKRNKSRATRERTDTVDHSPDDGVVHTNDADAERTRLTQRVPDDLLEVIEEKYRLSSRNATVKFMLSCATNDLLNE